MAYPRSGFTPLWLPDSKYVNRYPVSAGSLPLSKGDAVSYIGGRLTPLAAGQNPSVGYGVVLAVYTTAGRPLTFQTTKFIASGAAGVGMADVCWDPNQAYSVCCQTSVGERSFPGNIDIDASAASAPLGISGMAVVPAASASVACPFKMISYSPFDQIAGLGNAAGATNNGVVVVWNNHLLRPGGTV